MSKRIVTYSLLTINQSYFNNKMPHLITDGFDLNGDSIVFIAHKFIQTKHLKILIVYFFRYLNVTDWGIN